VNNPDCRLLLQPEPESGSTCPLQWNGEPRARACAGRDSDYSQARRQGIYLAACIVDEVAALGVKSPQAVIDEIRRRICELVRHELNGSAPSDRGERQ
jgi:hypothetical protein